MNKKEQLRNVFSFSKNTFEKTMLFAFVFAMLLASCKKETVEQSSENSPLPTPSHSGGEPLEFVPEDDEEANAIVTTFKSHVADYLGGEFDDSSVDGYEPKLGHWTLEASFNYELPNWGSITSDTVVELGLSVSNRTTPDGPLMSVESMIEFYLEVIEAIENLETETGKTVKIVDLRVPNNYGTHVDIDVWIVLGDELEEPAGSWPTQNTDIWTAISIIEDEINNGKAASGVFLSNVHVWNVTFYPASYVNSYCSGCFFSSTNNFMTPSQFPTYYQGTLNVMAIKRDDYLTSMNMTNISGFDTRSVELNVEIIPFTPAIYEQGMPKVTAGVIHSYL